MIRWLAVSILLTVSPVLGEEIDVRSGEHADFSRLVLQFENLGNWEFGRVGGGYELRADLSDATFDLARVFDLIPRDRITDVTSPGPGRLFLAVTCDCSSDAFEIRAGRVVIDIKDGRASENSTFEQPLASIHLAADAPPPEDTRDEPIAVRPVWAEFGSPYPLENSSSEVRTILSRAGRDQGATTVSRKRQNVPQIQEYPPIPNTQPAKAVRSPDLGMPSNAPTAPHNLPVVQLAIELPFLPVWPDASDSLTGLTRRNEQTEPLDIFEKGLLAHLSRAAAQGLISVPLPDFYAPSDNSMFRQSDQMDAPDVTESIGENIATQTSADNLIFMTAVDRDRPQRGRSPLNSEGENCFPPDVLDVGAWGKDSSESGPFGRLRTGIVGEFDEPNSSAVLALARRYIFLGFGAEAKSILKAFQFDIPEFETLIYLADIIDDKKTGPMGRLSGQISCPTNAALWAILAAEKIPAGADINIAKVLLTFSGFPPHLRQHLGADLAQKFLVENDVETATSIRNIMNRGYGDLLTGFQVAAANVAAYKGETSEQLSRLEAIINSSGPESATALAEFIEIKLENEIAVSEGTALLADAFAVENRDSEVGRRLTRAAIRAFAVNGQIERTFVQISDAENTGKITGEEARELSVETHFRNVQISSNADFLVSYFKNKGRLTGQFQEARSARHAIAVRLIGLGFAEESLALVEPDGAVEETQSNVLLASARISLGQHQIAQSHLVGLDDANSKVLLAQVLAEQNAHLAAAEIYWDLDMTREYEHAIWLAGDWPAVKGSSTPERALFAGLISPGTPDRTEDQNSPVEPHSGATPQILDKPPEGDQFSISRGEQLLEESRNIRQALEALLTAEQ